MFKKILILSCLSLIAMSGSAKAETDKEPTLSIQFSEEEDQYTIFSYIEDEADYGSEEEYKLV